MKTRCPCCGAENSLDALLAHDDARAALLAVVALGGDTAKLAVQYLGLFRPAHSALTFARMAKLLHDILPDLQRGAIERNGIAHAAPIEAWQHAFRDMLARRNTGSLKLPLKSHGYLYEIIAHWQGQGWRVPEQSAAPTFRQPETPISQTRNAAAQLQGLKR